MSTVPINCRRALLLALMSGAMPMLPAGAQTTGDVTALPPPNSQPTIGAVPVAGPGAAPDRTAPGADRTADIVPQNAASGQIGADAAANGEIVVTAQRRAERLTDVPASVTAISADTLLKSGITNTSDLARVTPGVTLPFYGSFLQPAVRGVTSTGANIGESPNVAMYIDGVYQPQQIATLIDLPDVQQVEILKGPQGALYGQNATGGAILVSSLSPSFTFGGMASASYGNYNGVNLRGYVTGPITEGVAASLAGGYQNRDGLRRQVVTGQRDRGLDSKVVRGKLLIEPVEGARVTLTGFYSDRFDSAMYAGVPFRGNSVGYAFIPTAPRVTSPKQFATSPDVGTRVKSYGGNIRAELDVGPGTINSITGYTNNKASYLADADYSPVNYAYASTNRLYGKFFSQELNFVSEKIGSISFLAGLFYLDSKEGFDTNDFRLVAPTLTPAAPVPTTFLSSTTGIYKKTVLAPYAEVTLSVTDSFFITAGGRYTNEKQRVFSGRTAPLPAMPVVERPGGTVTFNQFTPRVTARYALTPAANVYASFGKGFKSGVINTTDLAQAPVNPEKIDAYEIGFKGRVVSGLNVNIAGFLYNYRDLQVVAFAPPLYIQQNAATARIKGIEADATWRAADGLTFSGGVSFLDAHYRDFPAAQVFSPTGFGSSAITADLSGRRLLRAPKVSGNLSVNYETSTSVGTLGAYASGYYNSGFGLEPESRVRQGKFGTVDGELSLKPSGIESLRLVLWGKNLFDNDYLASSLSSQLTDGVSYAEPRTYGVRAEVRF